MRLPEPFPAAQNDRRREGRRGQTVPAEAGGADSLTSSCPRTERRYLSPVPPSTVVPRPGRCHMLPPEIAAFVPGDGRRGGMPSEVGAASCETRATLRRLLFRGSRQPGIGMARLTACAEPVPHESFSGTLPGQEIPSNCATIRLTAAPVTHGVPDHPGGGRIVRGLINT